MEIQTVLTTPCAPLSSRRFWYEAAKSPCSQSRNFPSLFVFNSLQKIHTKSLSQGNSNTACFPKREIGPSLNSCQELCTCYTYSLKQCHFSHSKPSTSYTHAQVIFKDRAAMILYSRVSGIYVFA